jgi:hypothetical protein
MNKKIILIVIILVCKYAHSESVLIGLDTYRNTPLSLLSANKLELNDASLIERATNGDIPSVMEIIGKKLPIISEHLFIKSFSDAYSKSKTSNEIYFPFVDEFSKNVNPFMKSNYQYFVDASVVQYGDDGKSKYDNFVWKNIAYYNKQYLEAEILSGISNSLGLMVLDKSTGGNKLRHYLASKGLKNHKEMSIWILMKYLSIKTGKELK